MFFSDQTHNAIEFVIRRFMDGVLARRIEAEPWDYEDYAEKLPFHVALVPEEIWKGAKFERSFVTSLGMIGWEEIARIIAEDKKGLAKKGFPVVGKILSARLDKIRTILDELEHRNRKGGRTPDWDKEIKEVLSITNGDLQDVTIVADLYVEDIHSNKKYCFEIKSPKPNSDQTRVSKEKIMKWLSMEGSPISEAYYALPFNPYGSRKDYSHPHPFRWFDMRNDEVVIMDKEFWDLLGGEGAFEALLDIFESVGQEYKERIRKEFLNL